MLTGMRDMTAAGATAVTAAGCAPKDGQGAPLRGLQQPPDLVDDVVVGLFFDDEGLGAGSGLDGAHLSRGVVLHMREADRSDSRVAEVVRRETDLLVDSGLREQVHRRELTLGQLSGDLIQLFELEHPGGLDHELRAALGDELSHGGDELIPAGAPDALAAEVLGIHLLHEILDLLAGHLRDGPHDADEVEVLAGSTVVDEDGWQLPALEVHPPQERDEVGGLASTERAGDNRDGHLLHVRCPLARHSRHASDGFEHRRWRIPMMPGETGEGEARNREERGMQSQVEVH